MRPARFAFRPSEAHDEQTERIGQDCPGAVFEEAPLCCRLIHNQEADCLYD